MKKLFLKLIISTFVVSSVSVNAATNRSKTIYRSEVDENLTVRSVAVLPFTDNLQGIYSRPVEEYVSNELDKNHHWELTEARVAGVIFSPDELETNQEAVNNLSNNIKADSFIAGRIVKGPAGIHIKVSLYLTSDRKLLSQHSVENFKRFEVSEIKEKTNELVLKLFRSLPYDGLVMSRQGQRVTLNLGKNDGITENQMVTIAQVIKTNRHPKWGFIVSSEKEMLGKVKILKIDDTLSFGKIVTEKEKGTIRKNSKITGVDFVNYANVDSLDDKSQNKDYLNQRPDGKITFGDNPLEWLPKKPPTFGMVGATAGLGSYNGNVNATTNLSTKAAIYPMIKFSGELWLTPIWTIHANLRQGILSVNNPSGSSPTTLSQSLSSNELLFGYNIRFTPGIWGSKAEVYGGISEYKLYIDDTSITGLTTKNYGGWKFGVRGRYPVTADKKINLGADLAFLLFSRLSEQPSSSGSSDNNISQFNGYLDYKLNSNFLVRGTLEFEIYSTNFGGSTVTSSSQRHITVSSGLHYLF